MKFPNYDFPKIWLSQNMTFPNYDININFLVWKVNFWYLPIRYRVCVGIRSGGRGAGKRWDTTTSLWLELLEYPQCDWSGTYLMAHEINWVTLGNTDCCRFTLQSRRRSASERMWALECRPTPWFWRPLRKPPLIRGWVWMWVACEITLRVSVVECECK